MSVFPPGGAGEGGAVSSVAGKTGAVTLVYPDIAGLPVRQAADSTAAGGNARGANAVDWQGQRQAATEVASGLNAVIGGGANNAAPGDSSWVPGGNGATTRGRPGSGAWASGFFVTPGDAQAAEAVLRRQTTDGVAAQLTLDGAAPAGGGGNLWVLPNNCSTVFRCLVVARQPTTGDHAWWVRELLVKRGANAAAMALLGITAGAGATPNNNDAGAAAWRAIWNVDTTNGAVTISGQGEAGKTILWAARIISVELVG